MKRLLYILFCCLPVVGWGQVITTVVGLYNTGGDGGPAINSTVPCPSSLVFDIVGNYYVTSCSGHKIRKIDTNGIITTIAGTGGGGFNGDGGLADTSKLKQPTGAIFDSVGNLFFCDLANWRIRRIDKTTGIISTIAGNGIAGFSGDGGPAVLAELNGPQDLCFDNLGNLYVSDAFNRRIRRIDPSGIITTFAGTGSAGSGGDGGSASNAQFELPMSIVIDTEGNLFIGDLGNPAVRIRKINLTTGIISTYAGTGSATYNGDSLHALSTNIAPEDLVFDMDGNLVFSDRYNARVRKIDKVTGIITTIAGNGIDAYSGDGGPAVDASLAGASIVMFDPCNNLYITEANGGRVRKVTYHPDCFPASVNELTPLTFTLFPNPATTQITITSNNKLKEVWVCNAVGQVAMKQNCDPQKATLDIEQLPAGVYFVRVVDENGAQRTEKLIKQ